MKKKIAIVGGGACALVLGAELNTKKFEVVVFEKNKALGRKFLVAGYGGLNITHSEEMNNFVSRYTPSAFMAPYIRYFNNQHLRQWLTRYKVPTHVGSSGRVFPNKELKAIAVLNALQQAMLNNGTQLCFHHTWKGFGKSGELIIQSQQHQKGYFFDKVIFCLGGASWPVTGSDGSWAHWFKEKGLSVNTFYPSNCAFGMSWPTGLIEKIEGKALKNCMVSSRQKQQLGELVLTKFGVEGSGVYPFSNEIREELFRQGHAMLYIDFKPSVSLNDLTLKIKQSKVNGNYTQKIKTALNLSQTQLLLLKWALSKEEFLNESALCQKIKSFGLRIEQLAPIEEAISSVGGIALHEINAHFELKQIPNHYAIGEMLDYDAPTGGYLLQSCFSMAHYLADYLNNE